MEPTSADVSSEIVGEQVSMDTDLIRFRRRKEPIDVMTGIFLKTVHFLNPELTKCVIIGIFKNRGNSLGILFKGRKGTVYWSLDTFKQFSVQFNDIKAALENQTKFYWHLDGGEDIKVKNVFGKSCAFLYDGEHTLTLDKNEWSQFVSVLPIVHRDINELFYNELLIQEYIDRINSGSEDVSKPVELPCLVADRLLDEVTIANGGDSGISRVQGQQQPVYC